MDRRPKRTLDAIIDLLGKIPATVQSVSIDPSTYEVSATFFPRSVPAQSAPAVESQGSTQGRTSDDQEQTGLISDADLALSPPKGMLVPVPVREQEPN